MSTYADDEYASWQKFAPTLCSCCDRPNASIRILMSRVYPVCTICYTLWYANGYTDPAVLREKSLGPEGQKLEQKVKDTQ
jgi:hypothetical protein